MSNKRVAFIVGPGHSGSTLLGLILGSHSRIFGLGEAVNIGRALRAGDSPPRICYICKGACSFWNHPEHEAVLRDYFSTGSIRALLRGQYARWRRSIFDYFFEWTGAQVLVDFSKPLGWVKGQLSFPWQWKDKEPILLYNVRDGRAVVNSYLRKYPERDVAAETVRWRTNIERVDALFESFPDDRKMMVHYEELTTATEAVARRLCDLLHLPYEPEMVEYWRHTHHTVYGNSGTRSLIWRYHAMKEGDAGVLGTMALKQQRGAAFSLEHYDSLGLAIEPDMRWLREFSDEKRAVFERVGGDVNQRFATRNDDI